MAMRSDFAIHEYVRPPRLSGETAVVLTRRLASSAPDDLSEAEAQALDLAREGAVNVQRIMQQRARRRPESLQPEDRALDGAWGAVHDQVKAWTRLPGHPHAEGAASLLASLFPSGLDFTNSKYEVQWVESQNRLERIEREGLEPRILELAHPALLPLLRRAHAAFGDKLGVGAARVEIPETRELIDAIRRQAFLIADYARVMSAAIDMTDLRSIDRFQKALGPLAAHRADHTPVRGATDTEVVDPVVTDPVVEPTS